MKNNREDSQDKINFGAIVQVRMNSSRLPGKVMKEFNKKPLIGYLLERLVHCDSLDKVVVATSQDTTDSPIADYCRKHGVFFVRGSLTNVAERFKKVLETYNFNVFVRVNGDSPFLDQELIRRGIDIFKNGSYDIVTNVRERTYPKGESVEVIRSEVFRAAYKFMKTSEQREHVTGYFYENPRDFNIFNFRAENNYSNINLSIDTIEDARKFAGIISRMDKPHWEYSFEEIIQMYNNFN